MTANIAAHLLESTVFASLVSIIALRLHRLGPAARHTLWLTAAAKFGIPAALFSAAGQRIASLLPADITPTADLPIPVILGLSAPAEGTSVLLIAIIGMWAAGSLAMLAAWIRSARAWRAESKPLGGSERDLLDRARRLLDITRPVDLRGCSSASSLGVHGICRPAIRLPQGLAAELSTSELEAVLLHELAHVRRWDNLAATFVHMLVCVFWFHPLLWWIERRMRLDCERSCDEMVIHAGAEADTYISGILKVCRFHILDAVPGTSNIAGTDLKERMDLIMSYPSTNANRRTPRALLALLAGAITVGPLLTGFFQAPLQAQNPPGQDCSFNSVTYPPGTVLQMGKSPQAPKRACVEGKWTATDKRATVAADDVASPPPDLCRPISSTAANECACEGPGRTFSLGAIVNTPSGKMRCDKFVSGNFTAWRSATPTDLGVKRP